MSSLKIVLAVLLLTFNFAVPALAHGSGQGTGSGTGMGSGMGSGNGPGSGAGPGWGWQGHEVEQNLILPQLAVGDTIQTTLVLANMGDSARMNWGVATELQTRGTIHFFRSNGNPLQVRVNNGNPAVEFPFILEPSQMLNLTLSAEGPVTSGWALFEIEDDESDDYSWGMMDGRVPMRGERIMATAFYTAAEGAEILSQVGVVPRMYESQRFYNSMMMARYGTSVNTGVAIVNSGSSEARMDLRLRDADGQVVATTSLSLAPGHQTARFIDELFAGQMPPEFQGSLEIATEDEGVVALGLLITQGIMTAIPTHHFGQWTGGGMMMP